MSAAKIHKNKKREVLPLITRMIESLVEMSPEAAQLEYSDNATASVVLRQKFLKFKDELIPHFHGEILNIRKEINSRPKRATVNNLKNKRKDDTETQLD